MEGSVVHVMHDASWTVQAVCGVVGVLTGSVTWR